MKSIYLAVILLAATLAGCGGGGGNGNKPTASQAFVTSVQPAAATDADESEPADISNSKEADDDDGEAVVLQ